MVLDLTLLPPHVTKELFTLANAAQETDKVSQANYHSFSLLLVVPRGAPVYVGTPGDPGIRIDVANQRLSFLVRFA